MKNDFWDKLLKWEKSQWRFKRTKDSRRQLRRYIETYAEDRGICWLCNKPIPLGEGSLDHVIPQFIYDDVYDFENELRIAHTSCNNNRQHYPPTLPVALEYFLEFFAKYEAAREYTEAMIDHLTYDAIDEEDISMIALDDATSHS